MDLAKIEDGFIVIKIPIDSLKAEYIIPDNFMDDMCRPIVKVADVNVFVQYFIDELNRESETGQTLITEALDEAFIKTIENGPEGMEDIDYVEKI